MNMDYELEEIPSSQRRPVAKSLEDYQASNKNRNAAIVEAYRCGAYTLKEIGQHFGLHYSTVSGIVRDHKTKT